MEEEWYEYDNNGNITLEAYVHGREYQYDSANQLIRAYDSRSQKSWFWTYDNRGNILTETEYSGWITFENVSAATPSVTTVYHYENANWLDQLTGYTKNGVYYEITSDGIGNPLSDGTRTYTWRHGRELATVAKGNSTWVNTYNADGMRIKRTDGTTTYSYVYSGSQLTQMTVGGNTLRFSYDAAGSPMFVTYNGVNYYYVTNLQGDVFALVNASGNSVVEYKYDPWGAVLTCTGSMATTLGQLNPLLYRGYVYDWDTGLYYLQSRYYNPELGRFINADAFTSTGQGIVGNNMFAYCLNNPVNYEDPLGSYAEKDEGYLLAVAGGSVVGMGFLFEKLFRSFKRASRALGSTIIDRLLLSKKKEEDAQRKKQPQKPNIQYPGDDPSIPPGDDYEWRGKPPAGGDKGAWVNKNTGEKWHPDFNHSYPKGPHWDYTDIFKVKWAVTEEFGKLVIRLWKNGKVVLEFFDPQ